MKILAKSRTLVSDEKSYTPELLRAEARHVWDLQKAGVVREIYFTSGGEAVLVLECVDGAEAGALLAQFPLAVAKLIEFGVDELRAYTGYARLFGAPPTHAGE